MEQLLNQIKKGKVWPFPGGIHPPGQKTLSSTQPITRLPLPDKLVVPLKQHIGANGQLIVEKGQRVLKGQALTQPIANWSVPVHAPTSGVIEDICHAPSAHPSALPELSVIIIPDGEDTWCELHVASDPSKLSHEQLIDIIHQSGIAGMGGAGFPTYIKADSRKAIEYLVVNAVECEPYITADDLLMQEHAQGIINGIEVMQQLLTPTLTIVGIEDNKPDAIAAMKKAAQHADNIIVQTVPTIYPSGGEKQLIKLLTNKEVPSGGIPADIGVLVQNVGTLFAINQAVYEGKPLIERVITVTGNTIHKPGNVWALLGTEIKHLLDCQGFSPVPQQRVVMGGPMMGFTLPTVRIGVVKTTNCILAPDHNELAEPGPEKACIRCSACADACPASLLPQQLQWFAKSQEYDKLKEHNLFDCIECGACAYVCPSEIPLVQYYRVAKAEIKEKQEEQIKAERAKVRFELRNARLEREQEARKNRHKRKPATEKSADEKQKIADALARVSNKPAKDDEKSAVAAAIARAKAKKQGDQLEPDNSEVAKERAARKEQARLYKEQKAADTNEATHSDAPVDDKKSAVAAAIARAKAKKAAQADASTTTGDAPVDDKKAAVAAAIARAKAKKAAQADASTTTEDAPVDDKKAAVAAAIARAKAKKAAQAEQLAASKNNNTEETTVENTPADDKKAAVAAAIAHAKAKKAAQAEQLAASEKVNTEEATIENTPVDDKKAAIAAAIARAKAKKAAQAEQLAASEKVNTEEETVENTPVDDKKAAIAAAIARAKAKKAAKEQADEANPQTETSETSATFEQNIEAQAPVKEKPELTAQEKKKAAVAAAIARAKAKKLLKEGSDKS
ncbi:electron transport complex subunit RsxC [Pseudoalteromonas neustonica]|uniref:Ion-translocating oxidoreductase complex subunit C n=1 Tax=Pseudoalteromonas neustonica TaxID=1840331 RepID=A0ABU9U788_9GAMM